MEIAGNVFILVGLVICLIGALCVFFAKNFKQRLLLCSVIDCCGFLTFSAGIILRAGFSFFSLKVILILCIALVINPITSNKIAYSAFYSRNETEGIDDDGSL